MLTDRKLVTNTLLLTAAALVMRGIAMVWQVWLSGRIGAAGIGLFQLVMSVGSLFATVAISGIRFGTTRLVAEELGQGQEGSISGCMARAVAYALFFGVAAQSVLLWCAEPIGFLWVNDARTVPSLRLLAWSMPAIAVSAVTVGYFTAVERVWKTAVEQLFEQLARMGLSALFLARAAASGLEASCAEIVRAGVVTDNLGAVAMLVLYFLDRRRFDRTETVNRSLTPRMLRLALPLALSAYARSALNTFRQVLTPRALRLAGLSADEALAGYGVINGMAFPILLFPTSLPAALAELLVPRLTRAQVTGRMGELRRPVFRLLRRSFLLSACAGLVFYLGSDFLGGALFHNAECARFVRILAPMVPFLYTDIIIDGCLKGLGEMLRAMTYSVAESALGLVLIWWLLPKKALAGYIFVLYFCEVFDFSLGLRRLTRVLRDEKTE